MNARTDALIKECKRQEESCLYTSTTFFIWLKFVRWSNRIFIVFPIVLASIATWSVLQDESDKFITASCALLAGLFPAISNALGFKFSLEEIASLAADFKNLQDRFRQAAEIDAPADFEIFSRNFESLMQKHEAARKKSATPPEWCFKRAAKLYLESGNGTQSAMQAYNCKSESSADAVARQALSSLNRKEEFIKLMEEKGLGDKALFSKHAALLDDENPAIRLRALDLAYKLKGSYQQVYRHVFGHIMDGDIEGKGIL